MEFPSLDPWYDQMISIIQRLSEVLTIKISYKLLQGLQENNYYSLYPT
jgi:hypothetical protein